MTNVELEAAGLAAQGMPNLLSGATGLSVEAARLMLVPAFAGGLLWFCFKCPSFRASPRDIAAGSMIGALIPLGWFITGVAGADDFDPTRLASATFVAPVGESLVYLMTFTGATINFEIATVGGVIAGSFVASKASGTFQLEGFTDAHDMVRYVIGGALMGVGGVMALGCTVGQGITGMSTLGLASLIALVSIVAGGVYGMKYLEEGNLGGALRALLARD